jgi:hypothetical protein
MATEIDWSSLGGQMGSGSSGGSDQKKFLRFESGKTHVFRPVGGAVEFYKFFVTTDKGKRSINVNPGNEAKAAEMLSKYFGKEIVPQHRFAINVIDRQDGQIKILEGGLSIFKFFAQWCKLNGQAPGGQSGGDWSVNVEGENLQRRYTTGFLRSAPLSAEEVKKIKDMKGLYSLSEVYKETPLDQVISKATGEVQQESSNNEVAADESILSDDPMKW